MCTVIVHVYHVSCTVMESFFKAVHCHCACLPSQLHSHGRALSKLCTAIVHIYDVNYTVIPHVYHIDCMITAEFFSSCALLLCSFISSARQCAVLFLLHVIVHIVFHSFVKQSIVPSDMLGRCACTPCPAAQSINALVSWQHLHHTCAQGFQAHNTKTSCTTAVC